MKRPIESDYLSHVAYARALEMYCDSLEQPAQDWKTMPEKDPPLVKWIKEKKFLAAQQAQGQNFCPRCGKRTPDTATIHTCTPPSV
jgi:hypothetical protein